jgi:hypothetical protein
MTTSDLIALLGDYLTILAIVIAFLSTQIEAWKAEVRSLEAEWSEAEHKANNLLKLRHEAVRRALRSNTPKFALIAPIILGGSLLALGGCALHVAGSSVLKPEIMILLFVPAILLIVVYVAYGALSVSKGKTKMENLA